MITLWEKKTHFSVLCSAWYLFECSRSGFWVVKRYSCDYKHFHKFLVNLLSVDTRSEVMEVLLDLHARESVTVWWNVFVAALLGIFFKYVRFLFYPKNDLFELFFMNLCRTSTTRCMVDLSLITMALVWAI